jgi:hypothetical protein
MVAENIEAECDLMAVEVEVVAVVMVLVFNDKF